MGTELGFQFKTGLKARDHKLWFCLWFLWVRNLVSSLRQGLRREITRCGFGCDFYGYGTWFQI